MKAYSQDLRERIVKMVAEGKSKAETARVLNVSLNTVKRMVKLQDTQGHLTPKIRPGQKSKLSEDAQNQLLEQVKAHPDASLAWHCAELQARSSTKISRSTLCRLLAKQNYTRKKRA
jgi:transposase